MTANRQGGADVTVASVAHPYGVQRPATLQRPLRATPCNAPATLQRLTNTKTADTVRMNSGHGRTGGSPATGRHTPSEPAGAGRMVDKRTYGALSLFRFAEV